jgi:hypothetical protein
MHLVGIDHTKLTERYRPAPPFSTAGNTWTLLR